MKVSELVPAPTGKLPFRYSSLLHYPEFSGCYVFTDFDGAILYIGLAEKIKTRIAQHLDNPEKTSLTANGKIVWTHYLNYDGHNLPKLERTWLNQYANTHGKLPLLNKANSPIK